MFNLYSLLSSAPIGGMCVTQDIFIVSLFHLVTMLDVGLCYFITIFLVLQQKCAHSFCSSVTNMCFSFWIFIISCYFHSLL